MEDVVGALTPVVGGVAQVFHDLLVLLLVAEVEEGEEEDRQEESGVGRVKERDNHVWRVDGCDKAQRT